MTRFHSILYVRGQGEAQAIRAGEQRIDAETSRLLAGSFRKRLLDISETFKIPLPNVEGVSVFFKRVGHTAGLAAWCVGPDIVAVTLLLGGFDVEEDDRAMAKAHRLPTETELSPLTLNDLRQRPRPLHAMMHFNEPEERDSAVRAASACLAAVFFSLLGATVER